MRVGRGSQRAPAGPSSPDAGTAHPEGTALDATHPHDAARRSDSSGGRAGGRQPAPEPGGPEQAGGEQPDPEASLDVALDLAREGDERGFTVLWRTLHPPLLRYLTVRGNEAPEDLAAETWLQVVRDLRGFTGDAQAFRGWLYTVARHRAVDQGRARATRPVVPVADPRSERPEDSIPSAEQDVVERETTAAALRLVASLPPDQAEMVMLRVVSGLDVATVAELVGKRPGAVRVAVHRALKSLSKDPQLRPVRSATSSQTSQTEQTSQRGGVR
jgi:RNA polymerase sigma-70 factor, ECF subfamily